jgi:predicted chitinase
MSKLEWGEHMLLLQQQQIPAPGGRLEETAEAVLESGSCWQSWSADTIASIAQCPVARVAAAWPAIHAALEERGIASRAVCAAAIATIAIETASTFTPVKEAFWLSEAWRHANLRYFPWYGRGYVQLTWQSNYTKYGTALGIDLLSNADLAMDPGVAAKIFAEFFLQSGAAAAAERQDWAECRRRVQGGAAGLTRLLTIVQQLGA